MVLVMMLLGCTAGRMDALEARIVVLEAQQAALEAQYAEMEAALEAAASQRAARAERLDPGAEPAVDWPVRAIDETHFVVDHARLGPLVDESVWMRTGRVVPHRGPDGEIDGFRLSGLRRQGLGDALGFKNADILHSVNGVAITSVDAGAAAFATFEAGERVEAAISRRGTPMTLVYEPGVVPAEPAP